MKKSMILAVILGLLGVGSTAFSECPDLTYEAQYASKCIDGYMWMMRIDRIENCVVYTVPITQQWEIVRDRHGRKLYVAPQKCTDK